MTTTPTEAPDAPAPVAAPPQSAGAPEGPGREGRLARIAWKLRSVRIFFKVLGIGGLVAVLFGGVILVETRRSTAERLSALVEEQLVTAARWLAHEVEPALERDDRAALEEQIARARALYPHLRYVVVRDGEGRAVAHTFSGGVPADVDEYFRSAERGRPRWIRQRGEQILDVVLPVGLPPVRGTVQVATTDALVVEETRALTATIVRTFFACAAVAAVLALALTHLLTRPVHALVEATERIRAGDFTARAPVDSDDEIGRLAAAFNQMAESLERYRAEVQEKEQMRRSLMERILEIQEDERRAIARELHDELGQSLLALMLLVQSQARQGRLPAEAAQEMEAKLTALVDEIHRLVQGMRPPVLDDYGLELALRRLVEDIATQADLRVDYQYLAPPELARLPAPVELTLYRIAQEALTNVLRHAEAERASVIVIRRPDEVVLVVEDQGRGFDLAALRAEGRRRLGLGGMQERAALVGGTCTIESEPGRGTTVRVVVPLERG